MKKINNEKIKKFFKKYWWIALIILILLLYFFFIFDIGLNSRYFISRDFNDAFLYRMTGNCTKFKTYFLKDIEDWGERCIKEKDRLNPPIKTFSIQKISKQGKSAYLQVELERSSITTAEFKPYIVNYSMQRMIYNRFLFLFPQTRWLIDNEYR